MPIYEYRCSKCHHKVSIFWRSLNAVDESKARCTYCGSTQLSKLVSRVRVIRGGGRDNSESSAEDAGGMDDRAMGELGGLDENDPRSLGHFMRKMADQTSEEMGPEFNEIVGRLEKGEDPEKIEQSMGDLFGESGAPGDGIMDDDYPMAPPSPEPADAAEATGVPSAKDASIDKTKQARRPVRTRTHAKPPARGKTKAKK
jgi:putative FmdB family regulatory protein